VGDLLQGLFKEAYSLQKGLMELLDKINLEDTASEEEVSDIVTGLCFFYARERFSLFHACFFSSEELDVICNSKLKFLFGFPCSDSLSAGHMLDHIQIGHCPTCQHMEMYH